jgi:hypothetical protein
MITPILIYSGLNQRAIVAFCRYALSLKLSFNIVANGKEDSIFDSDFKNHVLYARAKNELSIESVIKDSEELKKIHASSKVLILPSTEFLNRFLLKNVEVLNENSISIGLCERKIYEKISDKYSFSDLCENKGIAIPKEYKELPQEVPFVIKPKSYAQSFDEVNEKPLLVKTQEDLEKAKKLNKLENYYFQEYVGGKSFYLLYYFFKDGSFSVYSQENLIQQDNGASIVLAVSSSLHKQHIAEKFAKLFIESKFVGLVMVEIKEYQNEYYMIEANPRFWGPSQLILDSNMSLIDDFLFDNGVISLKTPNHFEEGVFYFWSGGLISDQINGFTPKFYNYSLERFFADYAKLRAIDFYLKKDTIKIYIDECNRAGFSSTL